MIRVGVSALLLCVILLFPQSSDAQSSQRGPVLITNNGAFVPANGVNRGQGTADDPFVIDGIRIDASGEKFGIELDGTTAHVLIRNCEVFGASDTGIKLINARNVTVERCTLTKNKRGVEIANSRSITLSLNRIEFNREIGIGVFGSSAVLIDDNQVNYNWEQRIDALRSWGIFVDAASTTTGTGNRFSGNRWNVHRVPGSGDTQPNLFETLPFEPETSCTQVFTEFFLFVGRSDNAPELSEPYCAELLSVLRSLPTAMRGRINQFLFLPEDEQLAGEFTGVGTVRLFNIRDIQEFVVITFHEIGHVLQDRLFQPQAAERWQTLHQRSGQNPDHFAQVPSDRSPREQGLFTSYGMTNQYEDFATVFEAYTRDTEAVVQRAQRVFEDTGETVLLEKIAFVASLFQGQPFAYRQLLDWDSAAGQVELRLQRAAVQLEDGVPLISDDLKWEVF